MVNDNHFSISKSISDCGHFWWLWLSERPIYRRYRLIIDDFGLVRPRVCVTWPCRMIEYSSNQWKCRLFSESERIPKMAPLAPFWWRPMVDGGRLILFRQKDEIRWVISYLSTKLNVSFVSHGWSYKMLDKLLLLLLVPMKLNRSVHFIDVSFPNSGQKWKENLTCLIWTC